MIQVYDKPPTEMWQEVFAREQRQRADVCRIAREWKGTPYQHGARIKGVCCDCTFPAKVYEEAGLIKPMKIDPYCSMAHLNRASSQYLLQVRKIGREITEKEAQPGDLVMYFVGRDFSHSGIIVDPGWPIIVHADLAAGAVLEVRGDDGELARAKSRLFFTLKAW